MFKSNDILRKQTALKVLGHFFSFLFLDEKVPNVNHGNCWWLQGERNMSVLICISLAFTIHVFGVYWWYQNDDLLYPLVMFPPKAIPPFWHAIFIIMVNGMFSSSHLLMKSVCCSWKLRYSGIISSHST